MPAGAGRAAAPPGDDAAAAAGPLRRCIVTGEVRAKLELIRFVVGPDGAIVPDISGRLPGRGLWLTARRDILVRAASKNLFVRAARAPVTVPDDIVALVDRLLLRRCSELIGLARRAGRAVAGFEKVRAALREGEAAVLLAASDGGEDGRGKVRALARDLPLVALLSAAELGAAFGREYAVHAVLAPGRLARDFLGEAARLAGFREDGASELQMKRGSPGRRRDNQSDGTGAR